MKETPAVEGERRYHHGDLRRALIDAARRLLELEGPSALSLRAVAREAGVSPAAPYHHFKDKSELLEAVAYEGWQMLNAALAETREHAQGRERLSLVGVAYVAFARDHPYLYRVMYDTARDREGAPPTYEGGGPFSRVREALVEAGADPADAEGLQLATVAAWCAAHGLAEMMNYPQFETLKRDLGGEDAFLHGVFEHLGVFAKGLRVKDPL